MKKLSFLFTVLLIAMSVSVISCKEDEDISYSATFEIIEPEDGGVFSAADEFHMEVDITGTKALNNAEMLVISHDGDTLFSYQTTTTSDFIMLHEHAFLTVTDTTECHFEVSVWQSDYANRISEEVHFTVNP